MSVNWRDPTKPNLRGTYAKKPWDVKYENIKNKMYSDNMTGYDFLDAQFRTSETKYDCNQRKKNYRTTVSNKDVHKLMYYTILEELINFQKYPTSNEERLINLINKVRFFINNMGMSQQSLKLIYHLDEIMDDLKTPGSYSYNLGLTKFAEKYESIKD